MTFIITLAAALVAYFVALDARDHLETAVLIQRHRRPVQLVHPDDIDVPDKPEPLDKETLAELDRAEAARRVYAEASRRVLEANRVLAERGEIQSPRRTMAP